MIKRPNTKAQRVRRHQRVRGKISGTAERPRLSVFRSENNIYAQIIDDVAGKTLCSASTVEKGFEGNGGNCEAAAKIGKLIGERAVAVGTDGIQAGLMNPVDNFVVALKELVIVKIFGLFLCGKFFNCNINRCCERYKSDDNCNNFSNLLKVHNLNLLNIFLYYYNI